MGRFSGERRGFAATVLAFYGFVYIINALLGPAELTALLGALAFIYGLAFFSLVAGYFWARWFAIGLGLSGLITTVFALFQKPPEELITILMFYGGTHAAVALLLWGKSMASLFDGRTDWRKRFHLDEAGCHRLGRAIVRATISLPYIVIYALAPKEGMTLFGIGALILAGSGLYGLVKMRTWGILAVGGAAAALVGGLAIEPMAGANFVPSGDLVAALGVTAALGAIIPFAGPLFKFVRGR